MTDKINVSIDDLDLGECEEFESATGIHVAQLETMKDHLPIKAVTALVWLSERRNNPDFSLEAARKVKISALDFGDENPTEGDS